MDLDIPHISLTPKCTNEIILHPTKKPIEHAHTPSLSPIITLPTKESTHREPPTITHTQALSTSHVKEGLHLDEFSWACNIEENMQKMLMHCKTLRGKIKDQEEDKKDFQILKEDLEAKLKEQG